MITSRKLDTFKKKFHFKKENHYLIGEKIKLNRFTGTVKNNDNVLMSALSIVQSYLHFMEYDISIEITCNDNDTTISFSGDNNTEYMLIFGMLSIMKNMIINNYNEDMQKELFEFLNSIDYGSKPNKYKEKDFDKIFTFRTEITNPDRERAILLCKELNLNILMIEDLDVSIFTVETNEAYTSLTFSEMLENKIHNNPDLFPDLHRVYQTSSAGTKTNERWWEHI